MRCKHEDLAPCPTIKELKAEIHHHKTTIAFRDAEIANLERELTRLKTSPYAQRLTAPWYYGPWHYY